MSKLLGGMAIGALLGLGILLLLSATEDDNSTGIASSTPLDWQQAVQLLSPVMY